MAGTSAPLYNTGGYNCMYCGLWIPWGQMHTCFHGYYRPWPDPASAQILEELKAIRKLLEEKVK